MLGKRIITAIIGVLAAGFVVNYGQWVFAVAVLAVSIVAWHEFYNMMAHRKTNISFFWGLVTIVLLLFTVWLGNSREMIAVLTFCTFAVFIKTVLSQARFPISDAVYTLAGAYYIGLSFAHFVLLRYTDASLIIKSNLINLSAGASYLWLALVGTWASDTFAYFIGSAIGKHKLAPAVSPGKTWEGTIGGIVGSIVAVVIFGYLWNISLLHSIMLGILIGIIAPLGDLVESAIKRDAGVKDSGRLLPGHGGVLDRFDSIMFVVPVVYYYVYAFLVQ